MKKLSRCRSRVPPRLREDVWIVGRRPRKYRGNSILARHGRPQKVALTKYVKLSVLQSRIDRLPVLNSLVYGFSRSTLLIQPRVRIIFGTATTSLAMPRRPRRCRERPR